jgi:hypothetical protein
MSEFVAGVYRQRVQAVVEVGGDVQVDITTHGGGRGAAGSYITAVFGVQVMVTMFDLAAARAYVRGWLDPADEWVFEKLPQMAEVSVVGRPEVRGAGVTVRAHGVDDHRVQFDQPGRSARVRIGGLTWQVLDRAAADSIREGWRQVGRLALVMFGRPE